MKINAENLAEPFRLQDYCETAGGYEIPPGSMTLSLYQASQLKVLSALAWTTYPGWQISSRVRPESYLMLILKGKGSLNLYSSRGTCTFGPGSVLIIPENRKHQIVPARGERIKTLIFRFHLRYRGLLDTFALVDMEGDLTHAGEETCKQLQDLCEAFARRTPGWEKAVEAGLQVLLYPVFLRTPGCSCTSQSTGKIEAIPKLYPAFDYIRKNLQNPSLNISSIAGICGFSQVYLRKLFRKYIGMSPMEYIMEERIKQSIEMLQTTDFPVETIAAACGFTSSSWFYRSFKQLKGSSPGSFRRLYYS